MCCFVVLTISVIPVCLFHHRLYGNLCCYIAIKAHLQCAASINNWTNYMVAIWYIQNHLENINSNIETVIVLEYKTGTNILGKRHRTHTTHKKYAHHYAFLCILVLGVELSTHIPQDSLTGTRAINCPSASSAMLSKLVEETLKNKGRLGAWVISRVENSASGKWCRSKHHTFSGDIMHMQKMYGQK